VGQVGRRRRRWPLVLIALVVVVAAALVAVDFVARDATQNAVATDVRRSTRSDGASVTIDSFPFLYDVVAEGRLDRVTVVDRGVPAGLFRMDEVKVVASQVRFERRHLLVDHNVDITSVGRATFTVVTHLSTVEGIAAQALGAQVTASGSNQIAISVAGHALLTVDLTRIPIFPQCPLQISHAGDEYTFSCTVAPVPSSVLVALSKAQSG
jgi:hypothetical protein